MCTAATYQTRDFYMGRTLDYEFSYGEEVVITPRRFPIALRHGGVMDTHYAIIGTAHVADGFPLYYDAVNEKGLGMAGLNFGRQRVLCRGRFRAREHRAVRVHSVAARPLRDAHGGA